MAFIRKISIGPDYKNAIHYTIDQGIINGTHTVNSIKLNIDGSYTIFVENTDHEVYQWKTISSTVPVIVEHNIDF